MAPDAKPSRLPLVGANLAFRLYLMLVVIFLPTFGLDYVYIMDTLRDLQAQSIETAVRMCTFRLESRLANADRARMTEEEVDELGRELKRIVGEPGGVESVSVFLRTESGGLQYLSGEGPHVATTPSPADQEAFAGGRPVQIEIQRGDARFASVSVPVRRGNEARGTIHMDLSPAKIGGSIPDVRNRLLLGAAGALLISGIGVILFFQGAVRRPIRELADAMGRTTAGDLRAAVRVRSGEIGQLAGSFNQMMLRLQKSLDENRQLVDQVRSFNEDLRRKIAAATEELAAKNAQLEAAHSKLFNVQREMMTLEKLATLGQVATVMAHELGTPLNAISGHLQLLLQEPGGDPGTTERLKVVDAQVDRLAGIVREVLSTMRVSPPRLERVDVRRVVADAADLIAPVAQKRGVRVELRLPPGLPPAEADPNQLHQVLMNLFTNAMDAMPEGGTLTAAAAAVGPGEAARLAQELSVPLEARPHLRLDVSDTGRGMDAEALRRAFEPFFTTKRGDAGNGSHAGLGLGLSICRQIVKGHGGEIAVRSAPGEGTLFSIFLPLSGEISAIRAGQG